MVVSIKKEALVSDKMERITDEIFTSGKTSRLEIDLKNIKYVIYLSDSPSDFKLMNNTL